jgi:hypothetical protein
METLHEAYQAAKKNDGAPGIDGVTFDAIEEGAVESFLQQIKDELDSNTYRPMGLRKKEIPKDGGKVRILSIPSIRDRVVQGALKLIHPEKTRLIEFGRFAAQNREKRGEGKPETFTFLGFTHYCGKRRSNGAFTVWRKTAKKRMVAKLHAIKAELRLRMHEPGADVGAWLRRVVTGYYRYHAVPGNLARLSVFGQRLRRLWWLILRRRSQRPTPWDRLLPIFQRWIPAPRVLHPYPIARFLATHPRWEPYA